MIKMLAETMMKFMTFAFERKGEESKNNKKKKKYHHFFILLKIENNLYLTSKFLYADKTLFALFKIN